ARPSSRARSLAARAFFTLSKSRCSSADIQRNRSGSAFIIERTPNATGPRERRLNGNGKLCKGAARSFRLLSGHQKPQITRPSKSNHTPILKTPRPREKFGKTDVE